MIINIYFIIGLVYGEVICYERVKHRNFPPTIFDLHWFVDPQDLDSPSFHYYLDTGVVCNNLSYINHSCNPNSTFYCMMFREMPNICVFSTRTILKNEFITMDYFFGNPIPYNYFPDGCKCGSKNCRG